MATIDGKDLLARLKTDDKAAMQLLFQRYYSLVCTRIHKIIKDKARVEDVAQEVFIKIWEKRQDLNIQISFEGYIQKMAFNEAISYIRKHKKHLYEEEPTPQHFAPVVSSEQQLLQNELQDKITQAINLLPNRCRLIFQLSRFEGLSYREIAEKLDISVKTVENQMGKALRILRQQIQPYIE